MSTDKHHPSHLVKKMAKITASLEAYDIHQENMERLRGHIATLELLAHSNPALTEPSAEARMLFATLSAVQEQAAQLENSAEALLALAAKREVAHV